MKVYLVFYWFNDISEGYDQGRFYDVFMTYEAARSAIGEHTFFDTSAENHIFTNDVDDDWAPSCDWTLKEMPKEYLERGFIETPFFTILEKVI